MSLHLQGTATGARKIEIENHLAICPECSEHARERQDTERLLREAAANAPAEFWASLKSLPVQAETLKGRIGASLVYDSFEEDSWNESPVTGARTRHLEFLADESVFVLAVLLELSEMNGRITFADVGV